MTAIAHFIIAHPVLFLAWVWLLGGCAFAHFEYKAGIE